MDHRQAVSTKRPLPVDMGEDGIDCIFSQHRLGFAASWLEHDFAKIAFVDGGSGQLDFEDEHVDLTVGQLVLLPPHLRHRWLDAAGDPLRLIVCCLQLGRLGSDTRQWFLQHWRCQLALDAVPTVRQLVSERSLGLPGWTTRCWALVAELLVSWQRRQALGSVPILEQTADRTQHARQYLMQHYQEPCDVQALADYCGCSYRSLTTRFKAETGMTCQQFHRHLRVRTSRSLLAAGWPILDAALHVGYKDLGHFYRAFKAETGQAPGAFVKALGLNE